MESIAASSCWFGALLWYRIVKSEREVPKYKQTSRSWQTLQNGLILAEPEIFYFPSLQRIVVVENNRVSIPLTTKILLIGLQHQSL